MTSVTSADGTTISVEARGTGRPVILVGGAFNDRSTVAALAETLAPHVTAVTYDRRGRGGSSDNTNGDYAVEREVEDLAAVVEHVGGTAGVFGHSSGASLALQGVLLGLPIDRLALYEMPVLTGGNRPSPPEDAYDRLVALIAKDDRAGAVELFLTEQVGVPAEMVAGMRSGPAWPFLLGQAPTLPYDVLASRVGMPLDPERLASISIPSLVIHGGATWPWMQVGTEALAKALPGSRHLVIPNEDHSILQKPAALEASLVEFFAGPAFLHS